MSLLQSIADSLIDVERIQTPEEIKKGNATAVKNQIDRGSTPDSIADTFTYQQLKDALSYYKIKDRSKLTRLKDMSIALVNEFSKKHKLEFAGTSMDKKLKETSKKLTDIEEENAVLRLQNERLKAQSKQKTKKKKKKKHKLPKSLRDL